MYEFAVQQKCWATPFLFQDFSLKKTDHIKYQELKKHVSEYGVLLTTDFYHIEDKLGTFLIEVSALKKAGVTVESMKEGIIRWTSDQFINENLKVAIYDRWMDDYDKTLELERLKAFVKFKTNWEIAGVFIEENKVEIDSGQKELPRLIQEVRKYNAILVRKFNLLHWRTSMFFKIAKQLKVPIYSMKEGGIYLETSGI